MKLHELDDKVVMEAIEQFYKDCSIFVDGISVVVANHRYTLPRRPRQKGIQQFTYFYAMDLYELFDYARGRAKMSASYVNDKCEQLLTLLFTPVSRQPVQPDWKVFGQTPLGLCILGCGARIALRREEGLISYPEVCVLSGWSEKHFHRAGLEPVEGDGDVIQFPSSAVRAAFEEHGVGV